jgi:hypothetical protein
MERFKKFKSIRGSGFGLLAATAGRLQQMWYAGVMVFTMQKGGLMYEASVGGQQFKFTKL